MMKYKVSKDFFNNEWKNVNAVFDCHILDGAYFENTNVPPNSVCYYLFEIEPQDIREVWLYFFVKVEKSEELNLRLQTEFLDVNEEIVEISEKTIKIKQKDKKIYTLVKINKTTNNIVKFIKLNFSIVENVLIPRIYLEIFSIQKSKLFEPIIHQDEITSENVNFWGSFGYGDFGVLSFGAGIMIRDF